MALMLPGVRWISMTSVCISLLLNRVLGEKVLTPAEERLFFSSRSGYASDADSLSGVPEYDVFEPRVSWGARYHGNDNSSSSSSRETRSIAEMPRLQFQALGKLFNFRLSPNEDLTASNFVFLGRRREGTEIKTVDKNQLSCYYQGVDDTQQNPDTSIAVELCGPVRGVVTSPTTEFVIEPIPGNIQERRRRRRRSLRTGEEEEEEEVLERSSHIIYRRHDNIGVTVEHKSRRRRRSFLTEGDGVREALSSREGRRPYFDSYEHVLDGRLRTEWLDHDLDGRRRRRRRG